MQHAVTRPGGPRRHRRRAVTVLAGTAAFALVGGTASALVTPGDDAADLAAAVVNGAPVTGAALLVDYACRDDDPATGIDESGCPTGVGDSPLGGFPTHGSTFAVLTTGDAAYADDPNDSSGTTRYWRQQGTPVTNDEVYDQQVLRIDLGPATGSCLAFDFRFLSEEYPEFVEQGFNDAFVAQLNTWDVRVDTANQTVTAPGDFAAGAGDSISVDASGPSAMAPEHAAGTTYDGATLPLVARTPVAPGSTNSLYLTLFDQGDGYLDSAVFVDNVRYEEQSGGRCKSLALDPYEGTTGVVVVPTKPSFSPGRKALRVPVACELPQGPIDCEVTATATFTPQGAKKARKLGTGSATVPSGGEAALELTTTAAGKKAVAKAAKQPAKLKKKARKARKQARQARNASAFAKARKLTRKATRLTKQARKASRRPLGTVKVTVSNAANGASEVFSLKLRR